MIKIIIDTNIFLSGYAFGGNAKEVIDQIKNAKVQVYCSFQLWDEICSKFLHGRLKEMSKNGFDIGEVKDYLNSLEEDLKFVHSTSKVDVCRDPKDNMILELTREIKADYVITGDKDLLTLNPFETTNIIKPSQFLIINQ